MISQMIRTYSELITIPSYIERYRYLKLDGIIGEDTFGFNRWLNQYLYKTKEWRQLRNYVIDRDLGCDLAWPDCEIVGLIIVHHLNPITKEDILERSPLVYDPDFLVCTAELTHKAIHYGDESLLMTDPIIRRPNDTCPWRK